jgi:hypothetical protein
MLSVLAEEAGSSDDERMSWDTELAFNYLVGGLVAALYTRPRRTLPPRFPSFNIVAIPISHRIAYLRLFPALRSTELGQALEAVTQLSSQPRPWWSAEQYPQGMRKPDVGGDEMIIMVSVLLLDDGTLCNVTPTTSCG